MPTPLALVWNIIAHDDASAAFLRVGAAAEGAAAKTAGVGKSLTAVSGLIAVAAVSVAAVSVKMAADFQSAMLLIQTNAGASKDEVDKMSKSVLELAGPLATAPDALATSLYHIESVGLRGAQALDVLKIAAEGAHVGNADLEQTTNALTATVASGIPGVDNMSQAMGKLITIVGAGDMKMSDLNEALGTGLLTVVKGYGLNLDDVGAALATFGDNNIRGADAATMLRMSVQAMAVPVKGGAKQLAALGISAGQLGKDMQEGGLNKALMDLQDHLKSSGIQANQVGEVLTTAFGKKAGPGLAVLEGQMSRFETKLTDVKGSGDHFAQDWQAWLGTLKGKWDGMKSSMEAIAIQLGTLLIPVVSKMIDYIRISVDWLTKHQDVAKALGVVLGGVLLAAIAGVVAAFVSFVSTAGLVVGAFAAVGAGIVYAYNHFKGFHDFMQTAVPAIWNVIKIAWNDVVAITKAVWPVVVSDIKIAVDWIKTAWTNLVTVTETIWNKLSSLVMTAVNAIENFIAPLVDFVRSHWDEIKQVTETIWGLIKAYFDVVWGLIKGIFDVVLPLITGLLKVTWDTIKTAVQVAWDLILNILKIVWDTIVGALKVFRDVFIGVVSVFLDVVTGHWSKAWDDIKTFVVNIWHDISDSVGKIAHDFADLLSSVFTDLGNGLGHIWTSIWDTAKSVFIGGINAVLDIVDGFLSAINSVAGAVGLTLNLNVAHVGGGDSGGGASMGASSGLKTGSSTFGLAAGGTIGDGFTTRGPQVIVGEGNPAHPEYVIPTDPSHRGRAMDLFAALGGDLGMPGLSIGGIIGSIGSGISNAAGGVSHFLGSAVSDTWSGIKDVAGATEAIAREGLAKLLEATWPVLPTTDTIGALVPAGINHIRDAAIKFIEDKDAANKAAAGSSGGPPGSMPSGSLAGWEATALSILGKDYGTFAPGLTSLIMSESGGNPNAINLTDSNAAAGHPSKGLMQTIDGTFSAYALPGHYNIYDPVDNILAGFRYAEANYGDGMIIGGGRHTSSGGYLGYDEGGLLMPGYSQVYNGHNVPEIITPPGAGQFGKSDDVVDAIRALGDRFGAELDRQARTIQTLQRQMAGAR